MNILDSRIQHPAAHGKRGLCGHFRLAPHHPTVTQPPIIATFHGQRTGALIWKHHDRALAACVPAAIDLDPSVFFRRRQSQSFPVETR
jgi:hypothetical protein